MEKSHSTQYEVQIGADLEGLDPVNLMEAIPADKQLTLTFDGVSGWVSRLVQGPSLLSRAAGALKPSKQEGKPETKPQERQIMHNLTGATRAGEVLALMGPSGSGKTSLLSVLGGRTPKAVRMSGQVLYNGVPLTKSTKRQVGYVLQDDLLYASLTVYETLYYAAMLRLPSSFSHEKKVQRVDDVIKALGLGRCQGTIIGGFFRRGISGGERKRVSVGHELLINPAMLLLDEPTSGLDSTTAMHLVATLRGLAQGGRAVLTTIHQPSSRLYQLLDRLLLLSEGHAFYFGSASLAAEYFHRLGYSLPHQINTADFILDLASGDVSTYKISGEDARKHLIACSEKFLQANPEGYGKGQELSQASLGDTLWTAAQSRRQLKTTADLGGHSAFTAAEALMPGAASIKSSDASSSGSGSSPKAPLQVVIDRPPRQGLTPEVQPAKPRAKAREWAASWPVQYMILLQRALKTRRFEALGYRDFVQFLVVGILAGLFWLHAGHKGNTVAGAGNLAGLLFFELMFMSMRAMLGALFTFPAEFKMLLKERASGMYRLSAFYLARTTSDLPMDCTIPFIFILVLYWMGALKATAGAFFANLFAVLLSLLTAQSIGLLIGSVVTQPKTGQMLATIIALSSVLVAGFFVKDVPVWIGWLKYLSFVWYGYDLIQKIQYRGTTFYNCGTKYSSPDPANDPNCTLVTNIQEALQLQRDPEEWPWEAIALIGWLLFFRIVIYYTLRARTKAKIR